MEITRKELYELIWKKPISKLAEEWGIPGQALRAYCNQLNIPTPSSGYWSKLKFGKQVEIPPLPIFEGKEIQSFDSLQKTEKKNNKEKEEHSIQKTEDGSTESSLTISELTDSDKTKAIILEVPKDPRKKILFELQKMNQNLFTVPEVLYAKDPLIIDTKEFFRGEKNGKYLYKNPYKSKIKATLNISVQLDNLDRALRIFSTIIKVLKLRGHQIIAKGYSNTIVIVNDEEVPIKLSEKNTRIENTDPEDSYSRYKFVPSGKFRFEILPEKTYYTPTRIEDTKTSVLEEKILNIIAKIEYEALDLKKRRDERERLRQKKEEERKKRELEEQKRKELEKKRKNEMRELKDAFLSAECYSISKTLREYVKKYESFLLEKGIIDDEDNEKLNWLKRKIDWLDPFIDYEDELLTEEDKQNLVFPESENDYHRTSYSSYNSYSAMAPRFTFWNNPFRRR